MHAALRILVELLELERLEPDRFRGISRRLVGPRIFGGQTLGQALMAAGRTVDAVRQPHSLHAYFLRAGDADAPVMYAVERLRDGRSFSTRRVSATQNDRQIFSLSASFQEPETGLTHQTGAPPAAPAPDDLESEWDILARHRAAMPNGFRAVLNALRAVDLRPVDPDDPLHPTTRPARRMTWFRAAGTLPDDPLLHHALAAYASDFRLLGTALLPHGRSLFQGTTQMASLDHAMWFHRPFRADEWLLYVMDSPSATSGRGYCRGQVFDSGGNLVASACQEGLMRPVSGPGGSERISDSLPQGG